MHALVLEDHQKVVYKEVEKPSCSAGQVLVKLKAAALNHRDQFIREGKYPGIKPGTILGSDGAGVVESVGEGVAQTWVGKEVIINPNRDWGENPEVQSATFNILGMPANGTMAEYVVVAADRLHEKPSYLNFEQAAALPLGGLTAYRALFHHGKLHEEQSVLINGIGGGVAQFAMLFAVAAGGKTYVTSSSLEKINHAKSLGAIQGFNYREESFVKDAKEVSGGFDVIIDSAGGDQLNTLIKLAKPAGRIVFYGATTGAPSHLDVHRMFWNQITLQGSTMGNDDEFEMMVQFIQQRKIEPVIDSVRPLENGLEAFDAMKEGKQSGKLVLKIS